MGKGGGSSLRYSAAQRHIRPRDGGRRQSYRQFLESGVWCSGPLPSHSRAEHSSGAFQIMLRSR
jgi:hypothetical protein